MSRRSVLSALPAKVRARIARLRREGATIDEIMEALGRSGCVPLGFGQAHPELGCGAAPSGEGKADVGRHSRALGARGSRHWPCQ